VTYFQKIKKSRRAALHLTEEFILYLAFLAALLAQKKQFFPKKCELCLCVFLDQAQSSLSFFSFAFFCYSVHVSMSIAQCKSVQLTCLPAAGEKLTRFEKLDDRGAKIKTTLEKHIGRRAVSLTDCQVL
jgi:hypothetical protein